MKRNNMVNLHFDIELEQSVATIHLSGKILAESDFEAVEKEVFSLMNQNYSKLIFDLSELTHTNSSGIAFFLRTLTKSRILGGELILVGIQGNVQKIFEIAKLNDVYTICADKNEAINHFNTLQ